MRIGMKKIVQEKSEGKTEKRYKKYWEEKPAPDTHATATGCGKNQLTAAK